MNLKMKRNETNDSKEDNKKINKKSKMKPQTKIILVLVILVVSLFFIVIEITKNKGERYKITATSSLEKIIEINELSTVDYTYNAIAVKYKNNKKDEKNIEYYVAYEGVVTAGIDFNEVEINVDKKEKIINIILPEVEIQNVRVDMGTLDYIYVKSQKEHESISQEAYKLCKKDLKERIKKEDTLYINAKKNANSAVEGLLKPWIESIDKEYKVVIK